MVDSVSDEFHIYTLEWSKDKMIFSVDGIEHYQYNPTVKNKKTWPYDSDYYFIFNIAIEADVDSNFEESAMQVDYIRVFQ